jgi:hypothetical protein
MTPPNSFATPYTAGNTLEIMPMSLRDMLSADFISGALKTKVFRPM